MTHHSPNSCRFCSLFYDPAGFCASLSPDELADLNAESRMLSVKRGETIQSDMLDHLPVVAVSTGVLSLQHLLNDGRKTIAALFMRGDIIDLRRTSGRNFGALVALHDVDLCRLSATVFDRILGANTSARIVAWESLTDQTFRAINHASDLAKKQALEKLASFIFECRHRSESRLQRDHVEIPIRRRDLAEYLGMQPETISRCFKELEVRGIIKVSDLSVIKLENTAALRRIANGDRDAQGTDRFCSPERKILTANA